MKRNMSIFILTMLSFIFILSNVFAQPFEEGEIQTSVTSEEDRPGWENIHYPVTTDVEATYDVNHNGILEPDETRNLLQERYDIIQTQGSTGVDADLLQQYDANGDGSIDAREAEEIREDME